MSEQLARAQVPISGNLRDVLLALDRSAFSVALVMGGPQHLIGIFTDGDVRRALLRGATLEDKLADHVNRTFTSVGPHVVRAEVLELMQARKFAIVPIVDETGSFLGCHRLQNLLGVTPRPNWAVVMAGGRGARLGSLTQAVPKPMLQVAGRPILERIVLNLVGIGIRRVFLAINYLGHVIEAHFGDGGQFGCSIEYLRETTPLGTAGALSLLPQTPEHPLLAINGDVVTQARLGAMLDAHDSETAITIATRRYLHSIPFGCISQDGDRITDIEEKPTINRSINAGIYVLAPHIIARVPRDHEVAMTSVIAECLTKHERVTAFEVAEDWIDVGQREHLNRARGES